MAHFAKIENNIVTAINVIHNDVVGAEFPASEPIGQQFLASHGYDGIWVQTSFNNNFRKQHARVGGTYNQEQDVFILPSPFQSWILDVNNDWQPPTPKPEGNYFWNEETVSWVEVTTP